MLLHIDYLASILPARDRNIELNTGSISCPCSLEHALNVTFSIEEMRNSVHTSHPGGPGSLSPSLTWLVS